MRRRFVQLKIGGCLDRYVATLFLASYATAIMLIVGLYMVLDMAARIDDFLEPWEDGSKAPGMLVVRYFLLNVPFLYLQVAPMVTLVAGMFTVVKLVKYNETVAALAAGVSGQRLLAPVFMGATLVALAMFALREWVTETIGPKRDALAYVLQHQEWDVVYEGIWIRDMDGSLARLGEFRPSTGNPPRAEVRDLAVFRGRADEEVLLRASRASWVKDGGDPYWWLRRGEVTESRDDLDQGAGIQRRGKAERLEDFDFTPSLALLCYRARVAPMELSFSDAREMARRDPDNVTYQTLIQHHLSFPLSNIVLLLVGLPILMRHRRGRGMEGVAIGTLLCVFFLSTEFVFRSLGLEGAIHPLMAAWVPLLFFGSLGIVLFDAMRT